MHSMQMSKKESPMSESPVRPAQGAFRFSELCEAVVATSPSYADSITSSLT
jgi:hypothetical protein